MVFSTSLHYSLWFYYKTILFLFQKPFLLKIRLPFWSLLLCIDTWSNFFRKQMISGINLSAHSFVVCCLSSIEIPLLWWYNMLQCLSKVTSFWGHLHYKGEFIYVSGFVDSAANLPAVTAKNTISMSFLSSILWMEKSWSASTRICHRKRSLQKEKNITMPCAPAVKSRPDWSAPQILRMRSAPLLRQIRMSSIFP